MSPRATKTLPDVQPILLTSRRDPFNDPAWLFQPKYGPLTPTHDLTLAVSGTALQCRNPFGI